MGNLMGQRGMMGQEVKDMINEGRLGVGGTLDKKHSIDELKQMTPKDWNGCKGSCTE